MVAWIWIIQGGWILVLAIFFLCVVMPAFFGGLLLWAARPIKLPEKYWWESPAQYKERTSAAYHSCNR